MFTCSAYDIGLTLALEVFSARITCLVYVAVSLSTYVHTHSYVSSSVTFSSLCCCLFCPSGLAHPPLLAQAVVFRHVAMHEELPFAMSAIGHMPLLTMTYACVGEWMYIHTYSVYIVYAVCLC